MEAEPNPWKEFLKWRCKLIHAQRENGRSWEYIAAINSCGVAQAERIYEATKGKDLDIDF